MEVSMKDLFPVCVNVLDKEKYPIHYLKLTALALEREMGVFLPKPVFMKNAENVREKLLYAEQRGTFYTGSPLCMGGLRHWFNTSQLQFTADWIEIPGNAQAGADGAFEALMRSPHMVIHNPSLRNTELLNRQRSSGLVLEHHVSAWFRENYTEIYQSPNNECQWNLPCNHDFKLMIDGKPLLVDVAGPDWHGEYGKRGRKSKTDVHLLCRITKKSVVFEGVVAGDDFGSSVIPITAFSPTAFLVWLNCKKNNIDYDAVASSIDRTPAMRLAA